MATITTLYDLTMVLKVRSDTFASGVGIVSTSDFATGTLSPVRGDATGDANRFTLLQDDLSANARYWMDGNEFLSGNYQAPMNRFSVCHFRWNAGIATGGVFVLGAGDLSVGVYTTHAAVDIAEVQAFSAPQPLDLMRENWEYLGIKWGIGLQ